MIGWLVNSKLERMWKEAVLIGLLSQLFPGEAGSTLMCQGSRSAGGVLQPNVQDVMVCSKEEQNGSERQKERRNSSECTESNESTQN